MMKPERGDYLVLGEDESIKWYASSGKLIVGNREFYPDNLWVKLLRFLGRKI